MNGSVDFQNVSSSHVSSVVEPAASDVTLKLNIKLNGELSRNGSKVMTFHCTLTRTTTERVYERFEVFQTFFDKITPAAPNTADH